MRVGASKVPAVQGSAAVRRPAAVRKKQVEVVCPRHIPKKRGGGAPAVGKVRASAHEGGVSVGLALSLLLSLSLPLSPSVSPSPSPSQGALRMAGGAAAEKEGFGASHTSFYTSAKAQILEKYLITWFP
jgi:hypothetical protein